MRGIYQHRGEKHLRLHRNEFSSRYNRHIKLGVNDTERALIALRGIEGKRLTCRWVSEN